MSNYVPSITDIATVRPMSERERWRYEFAKAAMQGLLAAGSYEPYAIALKSIAVAEALLAKLEEKPPPAAK